MSYILDALKKIEHEKNRKAQQNGKINISGDLFQERQQPAARAGIWKIMLLILVASLVTGAGTWYLLRKENKKGSAALRPALPPPVVSVPTPVTPPPVPVQPPVQPPIQPTVQPPVQPQPVPVAAPTVVPQNSVPAAANSGNMVPVDSLRREKRRIKKEPVVRQTPVPQKQPVIRQTVAPQQQPVQSVQTIPAPADIKVSGIAWQDERSARRAVVNGFLLKEGAAISGAHITDIQADRVRFLSPNGMFEIRLDSLPAEVKK